MNLLFTSQPLVVNPELAQAIGLNEAIVLQQMHYWIKKSDKEHEGRVWTYNTIDEWHAQFPFWSRATTKRTISRLVSRGFIVKGHFNQSKFDRTTWYSINYEHEKLQQSIGLNCANTLGQIEPMVNGNLTHTIPETSTETSTETSLFLDEEGKKLWKERIGTTLRTNLAANELAYQRLKSLLGDSLDGLLAALRYARADKYAGRDMHVIGNYVQLEKNLEKVEAYAQGKRDSINLEISRHGKRVVKIR